MVAADGREYGPDSSWLHADDGYDRSVADFETHYFHSDGEAVLTLPAGPARVTMWRGLENEIETRLVTVQAGQQSSLAILAEPLELPAIRAGQVLPVLAIGQQLLDELLRELHVGHRRRDQPDQRQHVARRRERCGACSATIRSCLDRY